MTRSDILQQERDISVKRDALSQTLDEIRRRLRLQDRETTHDGISDDEIEQLQNLVNDLTGDRPTSNETKTLPETALQAVTLLGPLLPIVSSAVTGIMRQSKTRQRNRHAHQMAEKAEQTTLMWTSSSAALQQILLNSIDEGTDGLDETAKARVIEARRAALKLADIEDEQSKHDGVLEHPVVLGGVAVAIGAIAAIAIKRNDNGKPETESTDQFRDAMAHADRVHKEALHQMSAKVDDASNETSL